MNPLEIWTVGHSTHSLEDFIALLQAHRVQAIADVRRFPGSRRFPQFGEDALREDLAARNIDYLLLGDTLGGRRHPKPDSPNDGWHNASFRGYADYLSSPAFADGLAQLLTLAQRRRTSLMCAELLWWRCHRALISDVLKMSGISVLHIQDQGSASKHPFSAAARIVDGRLTYAAEQRQGNLFD
jgi:uncharacterized protein (DUF488 family)